MNSTVETHANFTTIFRIVGTPPVGYGELDKGFTFGPGGWRSAFAARDNLTGEEKESFARTCTDAPYKPWMGLTVPRTHQTARKLMFEHFGGGQVSDQRKLVKETKVPIAVINGADEPYINLEFVKGVEYGNLWGGKCIEMEECLHAPFWAKPKEFQELLDEFVKHCSEKTS
jgi:pimeloyl-ACP methyl ester carboxylesterase